jgi:streptogramin lyase
MSAMKCSRTAVLFPIWNAFTLLLASTIGCGVPISSAPSAWGAELNGQLVGGQQPIGNASILLYAAGSTGNGTGAVSLLRNTVLTAADGSFNITGDYACPSASTQVYIVARGGNPGLSPSTNNTASLLMAALGDCGNLTSSTYIYIDEVTTAAAAWALAQFLGPAAGIGSSATNATGLRNAFLVANNLADTTTGLAGGTALAAGSKIEAAKLYTLADALSVCVNSAGGSACSALFAAATEGGVTPANTLDAALSIVRHPAANVGAVFNAVTSATPFQPTLTMAPNDWTMSIAYTGGGISQPTAIAFDSTGSAWIANYAATPGGVATKLSATGVPAATQGFADPALYESFSVTVDPSDNAWITNEESSYATNGGDGSLTKFDHLGNLLSGSGIVGSGSIYYPYGIAADTNGDIWVADFGHSQASLLDTNGNSLIGAAGYTSGALPLPVAVALDGSHNAWFATVGAASKVTPSGSITEYTCCREPSSIAVDRNENVWVSDYSASALVELNSSGTVLQTLASVGGLYYPETLTIDGAGAVWAANYHGNSFSAVTGATGGASSTVISPSTGFGVDAGLILPFGIALDASGNVWVTSFAGNAVVQFVGLATPVKTPVLGPPSLP